MDLESAEYPSVEAEVINLGDKLWAGRITQVFEGTFGPDCFKSLILKSQRVVPLDDREREDLRLKSILADLPSNFSQITPLYSGVLLDGFAYIVFPYFESSPIAYLGKSFKERMTLYIQCIQSVKELVIHGYSCDDICLDTFRVLPSGQILYLGLLSNAVSQTATVGFSTGLTRVFCSPEEVVGGRVCNSSNIFSLGILGYFILGNKDLVAITTTGSNNFLEENSALSEISSDIDAWVDVVLGHCLFANPQQRLASVDEILRYLGEGIENKRVNLQPVRWDQRTQSGGMSKALNKINGECEILELNVATKEDSSGRKFVSSKYILLLVSLVTVVLGIGLSSFVLSSLKFIGGSFNELNTHLEETQEIKSQSVDTLVAKSVRDIREKILFGWLKENIGLNQSEYSPYLAVLVLKEEYTAEELDQAFNSLMPVFQYGLFDALVKLDDPFFLLQAINRSGMIVESPKLYPFLRHEDRDIRIATIQALNTRNDMESLQSILRGFRAEKDEEIRDIYRKNHWVTRDREMPKSIQN